MQTDVTTPNIDSPIMLGVVTSPFDLYQTLHNVWYSQQHATVCANGPNITCTIKQCWELLTYKVVSVCTVLNVKSQQIWVHSKVHSALLESYNNPWLFHPWPLICRVLMWKPFAKKWLFPLYNIQQVYS